MSFETDLIAICNPLFNNRVWFDTTPEGMSRADMSAPFLLIDQVGGKDAWYVDNTLPDFQNARMQFSIWGDMRLAVADAARVLRTALATASVPGFVVEPLGAVVNDYNDVLKLRGARQDFSIWYQVAP